MKKIAILLTVFNRKKKTLSCLENLFSQAGLDNFNTEVFIVDGGSKDGTVEAIKSTYPQVHISVHSGLYWAGGMRQAFENAVNYSNCFDYFFLLNDDTDLACSCLVKLIEADSYALEHYGKQGIYIGGTCDKDTGKFTYGAAIGQSNNHIAPNGTYQSCDLGNANIMMVAKIVFDTIGGLCEYYTHSYADYDYTLRAYRAGLPVLLLPDYLGYCAYDHGNSWLPMSASLKKRIDFLYSPKGLAYKDHMYYTRKFYPSKVFATYIRLWGRTLFPFIWQWLKKDANERVI